MKTIISKKPIPFIYQEYKFINGNFFPDGEGIMIHGGAGIVGGVDRDSGRPHSTHGIFVPEGVATVLDDDTYERLKKNKKFISDCKRGVMKVVDGSITDQSVIDDETHDMLDNDLIPNRPYTKEDIENAGGVINRDGSINITEAEEDMDVIRRQNAGKMKYMIERDKEKRNQEKAEKARATKSRRRK